MPQLELVNLNVAYGRQLVLREVSLDVHKGEVVSLIGPSGSGKTTILRTVVGLAEPVSGAILLDGQKVNYGDKSALRALRSRIAIVFQQYNLFQNMTVLRNVTIAPIKVKRRERSEVEHEAKILLEKVGLSDKLDHYPDELSGGQQQRVAIARALALRPEILLLDEVTAALDPELVKEVLDTVRLLARDGMTMIIVSHEMAFVREVSNKVTFMADGHIIESGTPGELFERPTKTRTKDFIGTILHH